MCIIVHATHRCGADTSTAYDLCDVALSRRPPYRCVEPLAKRFDSAEIFCPECQVVTVRKVNAFRRAANEDVFDGSKPPESKEDELNRKILESRRRGIERLREEIEGEKGEANAKKEEAEAKIKEEQARKEAEVATEKKEEGELEKARDLGLG